jgi:hypothetical protein
MKKRINLVLQGKGGVGKSLVSSLLAQYLFTQNNGEPVFCADTDPVNRTFASYRALNVKVVNILNADANIDQRVFDELIEKLATIKQVSVIDNGAATFIPLSSYLLENNVVSTLAGFGKEVIIHCVITGGQAIFDTLSGLKSILESQPAQVVVWKNNFFGEVLMNGESIESLPLMRKHKQKILGFVNLEKLNPDTFGKDMQIMITDKMTFEEAMVSDKFTMMPRQRLKTIQRNINEQLKNIGL